jgi:hypothetical protein
MERLPYPNLTPLRHGLTSIVGGYRRRLTSFHIGVPRELGSPFFVFLACDRPVGIPVLQEQQRRLHLPVGTTSHRHHEGKEYGPEKDPEKPPIPMHSPKVVHGRNLLFAFQKMSL